MDSRNVVVTDGPRRDGHGRCVVERDHAEDVLRLHAVEQGVQAGPHGVQRLALHRAGPIDDHDQRLAGTVCDVGWDRRLEGQQAGDLVVLLQGEHVHVELGIQFHGIPIPPTPSPRLI